MPEPIGAEKRGTLNLLRGLIFPVLVVASVVVILLPLPPVFIDLFLACNITASVLILLTTIYVAKPLEFSVFPALLLGTTLVRLVLNLASTRLILTHGATEKTAAAGHVIEAFGEFVAGDKLVVGLILFCILIVIQFVVITKGAGRISEVAARFFLDGMPGKQMAIDAELNAHQLTPEQAKARRAEIAAQADFYGAMEGASKFVRGDAIAGILIMLINVLGGLYVGVIENSMGLKEAAEVFTKLTIGDGLVTQVPAFLISLASGLIVTRTSADSDLPSDVVGQLFHHPMVMFLSAGFLLFLSITGLPKLPLFGLAGACIVVGTMLQNQAKVAEVEAERKTKETPEKSDDQKAVDGLHITPIRLEIGTALAQFLNPNLNDDFNVALKQMRVRMAEEMGVLLPSVHVIDYPWLDPRQYVFSIRDAEVARGDLWPTGLLAVALSGAKGELPGFKTADPINGRPAYWVEPAFRDRAERNGYRVVEPMDLLLAHLQEVFRKHADELLTRQHVHELVGSLKQIAPQLAAEASPEKVKMPLIHAVLRNLLTERVPVRDLETIVQTIVDNQDRVKTPLILTEYVRSALCRTICQRNCEADRALHPVCFEPVLEEFLKGKFDINQDTGDFINLLTPQEAEAVLIEVKKCVQKQLDSGFKPVVLASVPHVRVGMRLITKTKIPKLAVIGSHEVPTGTSVIPVCFASAECLRPVLMAAAQA